MAEMDGGNGPAIPNLNLRDEATVGIVLEIVFRRSHMTAESTFDQFIWMFRQQFVQLPDHRKGKNTTFGIAGATTSKTSCESVFCALLNVILVRQ
jgi:hypothetical protein